MMGASRASNVVTTTAGRMARVLANGTMMMTAVQGADRQWTTPKLKKKNALEEKRN